MNKKPSPYGMWPSALSATETSSGRAGLSWIQVHNGTPYWLATADDGVKTDLVTATPGGKPRIVVENVGSRVHEYGGLPYSIDARGRIVFTRDDGGVFLYEDGVERTLLAPDERLRYGQPIIVNAANETGVSVVAIQEDHRVPDAAVVNTLVRIVDGDVTEIASGNDFYTDPTELPDGSIAYITWNHPDMPWTGSELWVGSQRIGSAEVTTQPSVHDGYLYFMAQSGNWLNLHRVPCNALDSEPENLWDIGTDCASPAWNFGSRDYAVIDDDAFLNVSDMGVWTLSSLRTRKPVAEVGQMATNIATDGSNVFAIIADGFTFPYIAAVHSDGFTPFTDLATVSIAVSEGQSYSYETTTGPGYALFYAPTSHEYEGEPDTLPPAIVMAHGGPTSQAYPLLSSEIQFWTSRGFAVVDVNYRGSTGYGADYRKLLDGNWGVYDVADVVSAVDELASRGLIDADKVAIRGGSAGGFTVLAALTFTDRFTAGTSLYGIGDLQVLASDTHKFESQYPVSLIGEPGSDAYRNRSPIHFVHQLSAPMLLLQGSLDRVVPPNQAQMMVKAVRDQGLAAQYIEFPNEGHGFRHPENRVRALEAELAFYQRVWSLST